MSNLKFHKLKVKDIRQETEEAVSVSFEIPEELRTDYKFVPGQYLNLKAVVDGLDVRRSYSICAADYEDELRVAVKKQPYGIFSNYINTTLKIGDELEVMTPSGTFTAEFNENTQKHFALFAVGSGITPIISLAKSILHQSPKSNVTLVYGNRGFNSIIFREELERLKNEYMNNFSLIHVFSRERIGNELQDGRLDELRLEMLYNLRFKNDKPDEVYVCGPEPLILLVRDLFLEKGQDKHKIHFELFTTPDQDEQEAESAMMSDGKTVEANVTIILDGEETALSLRTDGKAVLDAALDAGLDAPFSCKGGVCSTCKAKVLEGKAMMDKNYALEDDEVEDGFILTCQSHPITDKLIVSYDDAY